MLSQRIQVALRQPLIFNVLIGRPLPPPLVTLRSDQILVRRQLELFDNFFLADLFAALVHHRFDMLVRHVLAHVRPLVRRAVRYRPRMRYLPPRFRAQTLAFVQAQRRALRQRFAILFGEMRNRHAIHSRLLPDHVRRVILIEKHGGHRVALYVRRRRNVYQRL